MLEQEIVEDGQEKGDSFVLLLNKFPVIPRHFLLCTKEFVPQVCSSSIPERIPAKIRMQPDFSP